MLPLLYVPLGIQSSNTFHNGENTFLKTEDKVMALAK